MEIDRRVNDAKLIATKNIRCLAYACVPMTILKGIFLLLSGLAYSHLKTCHMSGPDCETFVLDWGLQCVILLYVVIEVASAIFLRRSTDPQLIASETSKSLVYASSWFIQRTVFLPLELYFTLAFIFLPFYRHADSARLSTSLTVLLLMFVSVRVAFQVIFAYFIMCLYDFYRKHINRSKIKEELAVDKNEEEGAGDNQIHLAEDPVP